MHWIVTDSGLGGLSICAELEKRLRLAGRCGTVRLSYFNASPDRQTGYNDLPDMQSRALVFDRALESMAAFHPDRILIACNTLSIVYRITAFSLKPAVPVAGIIDAGVDLFHETLEGNPASSLVIFGTRTTIGSGVHREMLARRGIPVERIKTVSCHGLAGAIENDPDGPVVEGLIAGCTAEAARERLAGDPVYAGLCCTHYTYVSERIRSELERRAGRNVVCLDPNLRLVGSLAPEMTSSAGSAQCDISVRVISKVELSESKRRVMARMVEPVSTITAAALLSYTHAPDLFQFEPAGSDRGDNR